MSDSQIQDYLEITQSLLATRKEWEHSPQIVLLTFKAITHLLSEHQQSFQEHKMLINEQSLKIKQLQLRLGSKASKKDIQNEVAFVLKNNPHFKKDDEELSEYDKLIRESRYDKERIDTTTIQQLKTIAEIISQKKIAQIKNEFQGKIQIQKDSIQAVIQSLKEDLKNKFLEGERERRELKDWIGQCKQMQSRVEESHNRSVNSLNEEKMNILEHSQKKINDSITHIVNHLQDNYITKQEVVLMLQKDRKDQKKSPAKTKIKIAKDEELNVEKQVEVVMNKNRLNEKRQWNDFKQSINKQIGQMVKNQTVNNLIDSFQKDILDKYQQLSHSYGKLDTKINNLTKNQDLTFKQTVVKSQKRVQKRSSPIKSIQAIQVSIGRLQRTILDKQSSEVRRIQSQVQQKIRKNDYKWIAELDRRQKHLCQVIEQTYNQHLQVRNSTNKDDRSADVKHAIKKLFDTNLFCRYLYIGTKECKKEGLINWEKESINNVVQNFMWKKDSTAIMISAPGIYRIQVGLYGDIDTDTHLLINGDPIAIIKKTQPSKTTGMKIRGGYFHEVVLLSSKSKIAIRMNQNFYGQAFLQLQQL